MAEEAAVVALDTPTGNRVDYDGNAHNNNESANQPYDLFNLIGK